MKTLADIYPEERMRSVFGEKEVSARDRAMYFYQLQSQWLERVELISPDDRYQVMNTMDNLGYHIMWDYAITGKFIKFASKDICLFAILGIPSGILR